MGETHWYRDGNGQELLIEEGTAQHEYVLSQGGRFTEISGPGKVAKADESSEPKAKRTRKSTAKAKPAAKADESSE